MISHMWDLKYDTNELFYKTDTGAENRLEVVVRRERDRPGVKG